VLGIYYGFKTDFNEYERQALREALGDMRGGVVVKLFLSDRCDFCKQTRQMLETIRDESPEVNGARLVDLRIYEEEIDTEEIRRYNVNRFPTIILLEGAIKYYGIPAGEEIRAFVETLIRISQGDSGLSSETIDGIKKIPGDVVIETIVTPSCPYCPYAALMANMFAFEAYRAGARNVTSIVVEAYENMDIAQKYAVSSVPAVAINGRVEFIGVPYEDQLLEVLMKRARPRQRSGEKLRDIIRDIIKEMDEEKMEKQGSR
jgi:glutaredoxin-like protein